MPESKGSLFFILLKQKLFVHLPDEPNCVIISFINAYWRIKENLVDDVYFFFKQLKLKYITFHLNRLMVKGYGSVFGDTILRHTILN